MPTITGGEGGNRGYK